MRCDDAQRLIESHLDGAFEGEPAMALRSHLTRCPACARELALAERIASELRELPPIEPSGDPLARVARVQRREQLGWIAAAAAAVVVVLAGSVQIQRHEQRQREMAEAAAQTRYAFSKLAEVSRVAGLAPKGDER